ncbi:MULTISPECIES: helix-turn-helix domain-containing protein [Heyndrickxia]|uniref:helix-turn-helix domain-containing protein n=1 Tax=Heyndrickxia TaxID=2837504 RepID=UPI001459CA5F|nr:helix-turn-helix transcriptional regulator [Heyndrickxia coagulans]
MSEYGSVIKQIRTGKRISQSFFEKRILLSQSQLSRIKRGNSEPTFKDVINILDILMSPLRSFYIFLTIIRITVHGK